MTPQRKEKRRLRITYAAAFLVLFVVEVLIALFVRDRFIRPYIGDVLVVVLLYLAVRIFMTDQCRFLPLYVFIFAAGIEFLQYFNLVQILGFNNNTFMRILIGSVFDVKDLLCYGIGCIILGIYEWKLRKRMSI